MRIKEKFLDSNFIDESLVRNTSTYCPEKGNNKELDDYFEKLWDLQLEAKPDIKITYHQNKEKLLWT